MFLPNVRNDQPSLEITMNWFTMNLRSARSEVATETISFDKDGKPKKLKIKKDTVYATILIAQANECDRIHYDAGEMES